MTLPISSQSGLSTYKLSDGSGILRYAVVSQQGLDHWQNEDAACISRIGDRLVMCLCDGVSSTPFGAWAAWLTCERFSTVLSEFDLVTETVVRDIIKELDQEIRARGRAAAACTVTVFIRDGDETWLYRLGDSPAWLLSANEIQVFGGEPASEMEQQLRKMEEELIARQSNGLSFEEESDDSQELDSSQRDIVYADPDADEFDQSPSKSGDANTSLSAFSSFRSMISRSLFPRSSENESATACDDSDAVDLGLRGFLGMGRCAHEQLSSAKIVIETGSWLMLMSDGVAEGLTERQIRSICGAIHLDTTVSRQMLLQGGLKRVLAGANPLLPPLCTLIKDAVSRGSGDDLTIAALHIAPERRVAKNRKDRDLSDSRFFYLTAEPSVDD